MSRWNEIGRQQKTNTSWEGPVKGAFIGRQFGEKNEQWMKDFFDKHPVLSLQEKMAFASTQSVFDKLSVQFTEHPEVLALFLTTNSQLEKALAEFSASSENPVSLIDFLQIYKQNLNSQLDQFRLNHQDEWDQLLAEVGNGFDQTDSAKLFTFTYGVLRLAEKNRKYGRIAGILLALLFAFLLSTACVAPAQEVQSAAPVVLVEKEPGQIKNTPIVEVGPTATPTTTPTDTPTPRPTNTPTRKPTDTPTITITSTVEIAPTVDLTKTVEAETKPQVEVVSTTLNVRTGPGTNYTEIVAVLKKGDVVDITGKAENGWWNVQLPNGKKGWVSGGATYTKASNTESVQLVITPEPPQVAPTATARPATPATQEVVRQSPTVTNNSAEPMPIYNFKDGVMSIIGYLQPGASASVINTRNSAYFLTNYQSQGGFVTSTTTGFSYQEGGQQVAVVVPSPVPNPENTGVNSSSYFSGLKNSQVTYVTEINFSIPTDPTDSSRNAQIERRTYLSGYDTITCSNPVYWVGSNDAGDLITLQNPTVTFESGVVVAVNPLDGSRFSVQIRKSDGSLKDFTVTGSEKIDAISTSDTGDVACVFTGLSGPRASYYAPGIVAGFNPADGSVLFPYRR